jgi:hypothetical protein
LGGLKLRKFSTFFKIVFLSCFFECGGVFFGYLGASPFLKFSTYPQVVEFGTFGKLYLILYLVKIHTLDTNTKNLLLISGGVLGLIAYRLYVKARAAEGFNVDIVGVENLKVSSSLVTFVLVLSLTNPSNEFYTVNSISGDFFLNDSPIGSVEAYEVFEIKKGLNRVAFNVSLPISSAAKALEIFASSAAKTISFKGKINLHGLAVPVKSSFDI